MKDYLSSEVIGQEQAVKALNFYIHGHTRSGFFPPVLYTGFGGIGKSFFAKLVAKNLLSRIGKPKPFIEISGASLKELNIFVESIVIPFLSEQQEVTLFLDEIALVEKDVLNWLLHLLQANDKNFSEANWKDQHFTFNLNKLTFLSATTNPEKLGKPLLSRFRRIELYPYKNLALRKILSLHTQDIIFKDNSDELLIRTCRGNPRTTILLAKDITQYCKNDNKTVFDQRDYQKLRNTLSIQPLGLTANEIEILKMLENCGPMTLTNISSNLGLDSTTVRRDTELFLLKNRLIKIDGKRYLTQYGQQILRECF